MTHRIEQEQREKAANSIPGKSKSIGMECHKHSSTLTPTIRQEAQLQPCEVPHGWYSSLWKPGLMHKLVKKSIKSTIETRVKINQSVRHASSATRWPQDLQGFNARGRYFADKPCHRKWQTFFCWFNHVLHRSGDGLQTVGVKISAARIRQDLNLRT